MNNTERLPQPTDKFETWEEFETSAYDLLADYKDKRFHIIGTHDPFPVIREIPYEIIHTPNIKGSIINTYVYELDETSTGFFIRVKGEKGKDLHPELWPEIDTTPVLGVKLPNVTEYILRFQKASKETGERARMSLLLNPSSEEYHADKKAKPNKAPRRRHLTRNGLKDIVSETNEVGNIHVWHPSYPKFNYAEIVRDLIVRIIL